MDARWKTTRLVINQYAMLTTRIPNLIRPFSKATLLINARFTKFSLNSTISCMLYITYHHANVI